MVIQNVQFIKCSLKYDCEPVHVTKVACMHGAQMCEHVFRSVWLYIYIQSV